MNAIRQIDRRLQLINSLSFMPLHCFLLENSSRVRLFSVKQSSKQLQPTQQGSKVQQKIPQGLWVVATPLGNLQDFSTRGKEALLSADIVLCEDKRRTSKLLYALGADHFQGRLKRFDDYTEETTIHAFVQEMKRGTNMALVSDAGTPCISDPGSSLIQACNEAGLRITPIPGPSAVITLLSICGFRETSFAFRGFFPRKDSEKREELELFTTLKKTPARICIWFESPLRIRHTLQMVAELVSDQCTIVAAKELTKLHEQVFRGPPRHVLDQVTLELTNKGEIGEWCFAIDFTFYEQMNSGSNDDAEETEHVWRKTLECLLACNVPVSEATKQILKAYDNVSKNIVYDLALKLSNKKAN